MAEQECEDTISDDEKTQEEKPVRLSLHLIVKRHLPPEASGWKQDQIIEELNKIKRVRLDRENIGEIDSLELLSAEVTNLYLQSNRIKHIQNLDCLPNLQVLVLCNNQINAVRGISHLQKLVFLDISENCIESVNPDACPKSLIILNLLGNPCVQNDSHRTNLIKVLPKLKQLDGEEISVREKIKAGAINEWSDGEDDDDDEEEEDEENEDADDEEKEKDETEINSSSLGAEGGIDSLQSPYKQLPKIQASVQDIANDMLLRSQKRMEESAIVHKRHVQEITNIRIKSKIKPITPVTRHQ